MEISEWKFLDEPFWLMRLFGTVLLTLFVSYSSGLVLRQLQKRLERNAIAWDDALVEAMRRPLKLMIWVIGIATSLALIDADIKHWDTILDNVRRLGVIIAIAWFAFRFAAGYETLLIRQRQAEKGAHDPTGVMAIGRLLRASIVITAGLVILEQLGFSISGVLAFGGVGGLAVGFAAKDMLANFFGGLMIFLDRPFSVGDWIRSPEKEIEGIVENIGWRMTTVRTFEKQPIYIPNSVFSNIVVVTPSRMTHRRIQESIGLRYDDISRLPGILQEIQALLEQQHGIDPDQLRSARFERFDDSSVNILLQCYTQITEWPKYLALKEDLMLKIAAIIERHGAEIAFPTHAVQLVMPGATGMSAPIGERELQQLNQGGGAGSEWRGAPHSDHR